MFRNDEILNYGFSRYENDEVVCYVYKGDSVSCIKKD